MCYCMYCFVRQGVICHWIKKKCNGHTLILKIIIKRSGIHNKYTETSVDQMTLFIFLFSFCRKFSFFIFVNSLYSFILEMQYQWTVVSDIKKINQIEMMFNDVWNYSCYYLYIKFSQL